MAELTARQPISVAAGRFGRDLHEPGLQVRVLGPRAVVRVMARRNKQAELARVLTDRLGIVPPEEPVLARGDRISLLWAGHLQWLALASEDTVPNLQAELQSILGGAASLSDQSDALFAVVLSGPKVRDTLAKLTPIDLHPRVFGPLRTALTLFGHVSGQITELDETPSYEVMVFRGFAESFWRSVNAAGAEFGIQVTETGD